MEKGKRKEKKTTSLTPGNIVREFSAGGVVYKKNSRETVWLIMQPLGTDRWQFPKGRIDKNETSRDAALREVSEEGGVVAKILAKLGTQQYFFQLEGKRIFKTVTFYLMECVKQDKKPDENEVKEVKFVRLEKAQVMLTFKNDKEFLLKAREVLTKGVQNNLI